MDTNAKLEKVFELYEKPLTYFLYSTLKDKYLLEDAIQETFIKLLKHIDKLDDLESSKSKAYIFTIARNSAIDLLRKRKRSDNVTKPLDENVLYIEDENNVDKFLAETVFSEELDIAISKLNEQDKELIHLKFSMDMPDEQIAEIMCVSTSGAVRVRLSRAKRKLHDLLLGDLDHG